MTRGYFVTGTDTGVGKTLVSAALLHVLSSRGLHTAAMKPVASGCTPTPDGPRSDDALTLLRHATVQCPYAQCNPYSFVPAIAPHLAAHEARVRIEPAAICSLFDALKAGADAVVVEGVGGWSVPLNERETVADLARALQLPVILVVGLRLGCLNHALLTAEAIARDECVLAGWIANQPDPEMERVQDNISALTERIRAPHLGTIAWQAQPDVAAAARLLRIELQK